MLRRPTITLVLGIGIFVALALGLLGTQLASPIAATSGPAGADSTTGSMAIESHFPGSTQNPTLILLRFPQSVWDHPAPLATAQQRLARLPGLQTLAGPLDPNGVPLTAAQFSQLHAQLGSAAALPPTLPIAGEGTPSAALYNAYRATAQYISTDGQTIQFMTMFSTPAFTPAAQAAIPAMRASVGRVSAAAGATASGVYSQDAIGYDVTQVSQQDLAHIVPLVVGLIALLLALVLRSLVAPLYLVVSVLLTYLATLGVIGFMFIHAAGEAGISFILPFALLVFLVALGSDYNILIMTRIREEAGTKPIGMAVRDALAATGGTITTAGIVLAGTFAVLGFTSTGNDNRQFGFGIATGILLDTFLLRTLLIPAVVVLLGRWSWWPAPIFRTRAARQGPITAPGTVDVPSGPGIERAGHPARSGE